MQVRGEELLFDALRDLNIITIYDSPDEAHLSLALREMNELLDQLATEKLYITGSESHDFDFVAGKGSYTIGPGGDWDLPDSPEQIDLWSVVQSAGQSTEREYSRREPYDERQWRAVTSKLESAEYPVALYSPRKFNDSGQTTVFVSPVPSGSTYKARLYLHTPAITAIVPNATYNLPRGYKKALRKLLAKELMQSLQRDYDEVLVTDAMKALKLIKRQNRRFPRSPVDASWTSGSRRSHGGSRNW